MVLNLWECKILLGKYSVPISNIFEKHDDWTIFDMTLDYYKIMYQTKHMQLKIILFNKNIYNEVLSNPANISQLPGTKWQGSQAERLIN